MWTKIGGTLAVLVLAFAIGSFLLPGTATVSRSLEVQAPASVIFAQLDRMENFNRWSPWKELDPEAAYEFSGPPAGVGASMAWNGAKVGQGRQTITVREPYKRLVTDLDFGSRGKAEATLSLDQRGPVTTVTWAFRSELGFNPIDRWMGLLMPGFIGKDYERGLAKLKQVAEALPPTDFGTVPIAFETARPRPWAYVERSSGADTATANNALKAAFDDVADGIVARGVKPNGFPLAVTLSHDGTSYRFRAGWPYALQGTPPPAAGPVQFGDTPGGFVMQGQHPGTARTLPETYAAMEAALIAYGFEQVGSPWETYLENPNTTPVGDLPVALMIPIR